MAKVTKTGTGTNVKSTLVIRLVEIILQKYPGKLGSDMERAIAKMPYKLFYDGVEHKVADAKSKLDGSMIIPIPAGVKVELEVFGSRYALKVFEKIEPPNTWKGVKRRLTMLGHPVKAMDDTIDAKTDGSVLRFQADAGLPITGPDNGNLNKATQDALKNAAGE
jgi:hypothetical protein